MIKTIGEMTNESIKFVETENLFSVSMGKGLEGLNQYYDKAVKFQNELGEKLGVNIEESMNYQALFNSMSKSMGISAKYAYMLSENFTKLGYDLSSLYNIDPENAMQKLRAGLAGQTKPLRDLGLDVTQQSLQPIADSLGIERSVKNMSQAEKMILRYIAVINQAKSAQGDFARTMESPANQIRIFNAQVIAFKRNMGNLWQGLLGGILPYVNAIMMVINELLKMVAKLFGFKIADQKINLSADIGADTLASDLGSASGKAKELKNQLMGWDEINNISLPSSSGGGSSGGISGGGIDQRLLDAMKEYDNLMSKVKSKASDIRDKIMQWLGFTKKINPFTGEISWKYTGMSKSAKIILGILKGILGLYIGVKLLKLIGWLNTLGKVIKGTIPATTSFQNGLALIGKGSRDLKAGLKLGVEQFKLYRESGISTGKALAKTGQNMLDLIPSTVRVGVGIAGLVASCISLKSSMEKLKDGTISTGQGLLSLAGGLAGATASGAILGSVFGPLGTAIGAIAGFTIGAVTALISYNDVSKKLRDNIKENGKEIQNTTKAMQEQRNAIQDNVNSQLAQIEYTGNLAKELESLTESNGKVKAGYEDRVKFILTQLNDAFGTEYELTSGRISQNGELVGSINEITDSIYKQITAKKAEILLNANEEVYANAIKNNTKLYQQKETAIENCKNAQQALDEKLGKYGLTIDDVTNRSFKFQQALKFMGVAEQIAFYKTLKAYDDASANVEESTNNWKANLQDIVNYENLATASVSGDMDKINQEVQNMTNVYETESGKQILTIQQQMNKEIKIAKDKRDLIIKTNGEITANQQAQLDASVRATADALVEQTKTVYDLTPDNVGAWRDLGEYNYNIYQEKLDKLDPATRNALNNMIGTINGVKPKVASTAGEMGQIMKDSLDKSPEMSKVGTDIVKEYLSGLSKKDQKRLLKACGVDNVKEVMNGLKEGDLSEETAINILKGLDRGLQNNYWRGRTLSTARSFADKIIGKFNQSFGIHSPSRKTRTMGIYLLQGLRIGFKKESGNVLNTVSDFSNQLLNNLYNHMSEFNDGIKIDTKDFKIDANEYVDYGAVSGSISAKINNNNLADVIANGVINGMKQSSIQVDIKAESEEGIIVKKASEGFREFVEQTGELPFPVPV